MRHHAVPKDLARCCDSCRNAACTIQSTPHGQLAAVSAGVLMELKTACVAYQLLVQPGSGAPQRMPCTNMTCTIESVVLFMMACADSRPDNPAAAVLLLAV